MPDKTVAVNRRARHEYSVDETLEAGLVLSGTEIKSIRAGRVNLAGIGSTPSPALYFSAAVT